MDAPSAKARSLGLSPRAPPTIAIPKRPALVGRHQSAPVVPRHDQSRSQLVIDTVNSIEASASGSKPSSRKGSWSYASSQNDARRPSTTVLQSEHLVQKLVVLGNAQVGKSAFIKAALDLRQHSESPISSSWVSLGGAVHRVQMVELDLHRVRVVDGRHISWPDYVDDVPLSSPDAVICIYDRTNMSTATGLPTILSAVSNLDLPVQLVVIKAGAATGDQGAHLAFLDKVRANLPHVVITELSAEDTTGHPKKCMLLALKAILAERSSFATKTERALPLRPNQRSHAALAHAYPGTSRSLPEPYELEAVAGLDTDIVPERKVSQDTIGEVLATVSARSRAQIQASDLRDESNMPQRPYTPDSEVDSLASPSVSPAEKQQRQAPAPQTPESYNTSFLRRPGTAGTVDSRINQTFFHGTDDDSPIDPSPTETSLINKPKEQEAVSPDQGVLFTDLVDRLLQLPQSKSDSRFGPAFLCLYRAFAPPMLLLVEIIDRFARIDRKKTTRFDKVGELLRYLQVMALWTATYPGDFADNTVHDLAATFVHDIQKSKHLAPAAKEISNNLIVRAKDEDMEWAYQNAKLQHKQHERAVSTNLLSNKEWRSATHDGTDSDVEFATLTSHAPGNRKASTASSVASSTALARSQHISSQSAVNLASFQNACEQAQRLTAVPHINLSKLQWHQFMDTPTEELARELTRIDWVRYAAIRPRDFVREVSLPESQRRSSNIALMIRHFNHVSYFVAGMILIRDKPKHRAEAVGKVMDLAWKVRQLNNYNCVNAIVAGMQNTAITRLNQTMELVPVETQRQFMRLNVLVDSARSYATYRIAWDNTFSERIPLIPSLMRDLKVAMLANSTFVNDNHNRICWKKFEIMGDAIVSIQRSQEVPYTFDQTARTNDITKLFLETKVVESAADSVDPSEGLYDRSKMIEPQPGSSDTKKKFDWLRR